MSHCAPRKPPCPTCIRFRAPCLAFTLFALACGGTAARGGQETDDDLLTSDEHSSATSNGKSDDAESGSDTSHVSTGDSTDDDAWPTTPKFDLDGDMTWTTQDEDFPLYLLHVSSDLRLLYVSIVDGSYDEVCELKAGADGLPSGTPSLTFNREDRLFVSDGSALWEIGLSNCTVDRKGKFGSGISGVNGILAGPGNELYGISGSLNQLIEIDVESGVATPVGELGQKWGTHGASWSGEENGIFGINGSTNSLYRIDPQTGAATSIAEISGVEFTSVGMEIHPRDGTLYACTGDANLYRIAPDGTASVVGEVGWKGCNNLAAPFGMPVLPPD